MLFTISTFTLAIIYTCLRDFTKKGPDSHLPPTPNPISVAMPMHHYKFFIMNNKIVILGKSCMLKNL